jgi:hypothetical protein
MLGLHGKSDRPGVGVSALYTKIFVQNIFQSLFMDVLLVLLPQKQDVQVFGAGNVVTTRTSIIDYPSNAHACDQSADVLMQLCLPKELITIVLTTI